MYILSILVECVFLPLRTLSVMSTSYNIFLVCVQSVEYVCIYVPYTFVSGLRGSPHAALTMPACLCNLSDGDDNE